MTISMEMLARSVHAFVPSVGVREFEVRIPLSRPQLLMGCGYQTRPRVLEFWHPHLGVRYVINCTYLGDRAIPTVCVWLEYDRDSWPSDERVGFHIRSLAMNCAEELPCSEVFPVTFRELVRHA